MKQFPPLSQWFNFTDYSDFNGCSKIEVNMKEVLSSKQIHELSVCYAKYLCRLRCITSDDLVSMYKAIDQADEYTIPYNMRERIIYCFYTGFISEKRYQETNDYRNSFDNDAVLGYMGECFYYLVREQYLKDKKILIEPIKPKQYSKTSGIDFIEIRQDASGYYMLIGEIKTTTGSISSRSNEIIRAFTVRADKTFAEMYFSVQNNVEHSGNPSLLQFINDMNEIFYYTGNKLQPQKKYSGVINYSYHGLKVSDSILSNYKTALSEKVYDASDCRRIKLIGIYNIGDLFDKVRDIIWDCLLT